VSSCGVTVVLHLLGGVFGFLPVRLDLAAQLGVKP
jgi:hypothetical protein